MERGTLNSGNTAIEMLEFAQCWSLDATGNWSGFYEDIKKEDGSQVYYAPAQTIRLLLRYRHPANADSYMGHARSLFDWVMDGLAFVDRDFHLGARAGAQ